MNAIHEGGGVFELRHPPFLIFGIRNAYKAGIITASAKPGVESMAGGADFGLRTSCR